MPFSSGTYSVVYNWTTESAAAPIEIAKLDQQDADMAAALSTCLLRDGTGLPTASIPFNSQRLTGLGDATAATDALNRQTADARYLPSGSLATDRLLGRDTAGTGAPEALTVSGGVEFTGTGGIQRSALTGDVTASAGSNATTIANDAVSYAKMQNVSATSRVLGRVTAGAGDVEELTPANLVAFITTADGAGSGLDADLLDGQSGAFYQSASNLNAGTIPDARIQASGVTQHQASLAIAFTQLTGSIASAQVPQAAVTQHQAALSIAASQLTGTLADARVAQSNVTQHQAALAIAASQVTSGTFADARVAQSNVTQHQAALAINADQASTDYADDAATTYTLGTGDAESIRRFTSASAITVTLPSSTPSGWAIGDSIVVIRGGTGTLTFSSAGTIRSPGGSAITVQNGKCCVTLAASGVWELSGNL